MEQNQLHRLPVRVYSDMMQDAHFNVSNPITMSKDENEIESIRKK